jgi:hypothetical protein
LLGSSRVDRGFLRHAIRRQRFLFLHEAVLLWAARSISSSMRSIVARSINTPR